MVKMKFFEVFVLVVGTLASPSLSFCDTREQNGDLARAAVRGNEFIRSKLADENTKTFDYIRGAAFNSLRLGGFTIEMLKDLGLDKFGEDLDTVGINNITTGRIAYYVQGVQAICKNPQAFRGFDLIKRLKDGIKTYPVAGFNHPFPYSLAVLALCNSGHGNDSFRNYTVTISRMIRDSINNNPRHSGDTISLATMALTCMYNKTPKPRPCYYRWYRWMCYYRRRRSLRYLLRSRIRNAARWLRRQQKRDGSFGNSITTALVTQALASASCVYHFSGYRCAKATEFILKQQAADGSFSSPLVATTMQVTPILIGAIPEDITSIKCPKTPPINNTKIRVCVRVEFLTTSTNETEVRANASAVHLRVVSGTNAYTLLKEASKINECYKFTYKMTAFGRSITSICGVHREPANKKYWMIYIGPNTPASTGIDNLKPKDGTCVIFRFMKLNFR